MNDERSDPEQEARLRAAAAALPREIEPAQDLWPAIRARIDATRVRPLVGSAVDDGAMRRSPWGSTIRLASAAAALVLLSVTATVQVVRWRGETASERAMAARAFAAVDAFERSSGELVASFDQRGAALDSRTRAVLERSLRTIDGAIAEARAALDEDPSNPAVQAFVAAAYRQKIDFLRRANGVAELQGS